MGDFNEWLYESIEIYCNGRKDPHDIYPFIDLSDAKLNFMDGLSSLEYSKLIRL